MITKLSHATIYVNNQDEAKKFYTEKLGFEVRTDMTIEGFRWLTVGPTSQPDLEIVLMEPKAGFMFDEATVQTIRELIAKGAMGAGVFDTDDCHATYEELKKKGVEFLCRRKNAPMASRRL